MTPVFSSREIFLKSTLHVEVISFLCVASVVQSKATNIKINNKYSAAYIAKKCYFPRTSCNILHLRSAKTVVICGADSNMEQYSNMADLNMGSKPPSIASLRLRLIRCHGTGRGAPEH